MNPLIIIDNGKKNDIDVIIDMFRNNTLSTNCDVLGKGWTATVYSYKNYAIKVFRKSDDPDEFDMHDKQDHIYLNMFNHYSNTPDLYAYIENEIIIMEKIDGVPISKYPFKNNIHSYFSTIINFCKDALRNGLLPRDLHDENIVIDSTGKIFIIDVGSFMKKDEANDLRKEVNLIIREMKNLKQFLSKNRKGFYLR